MCTVLLPLPGVNLTAVIRYIISTLEYPTIYTDEPSVDSFVYIKGLEESYDVTMSMNCHVMNVKIS